jgi:O-succinylbenzoic acid--CoA ligase
VNDHLSILAAARDAPATAALLVGNERYTFAELADLTRARLVALTSRFQPGRAYPLVGTNSFDTVITLYALLEAGVPVLLLHPKSTPAERDAELSAATAVLPEDAAALLYTSGTTGRPRAAVLTRSALLASAQASGESLGWRPDDCWLLAMPIARIGGLSILTRCLAARRCVALASGFDATQLPKWIESYRTTLISLVPTMLALLFEQLPEWRPPPFLRAVLVGGAAAPPQLLEEASRRRLPIVITYGCTESCSHVVATPYDSRFEAGRCGVGRPLLGAEVRVVDHRIEMRGPMRMAGYLDESPLASTAWFDTGDLGDFDAEGFLHLHGRRGDLIVSGGENVYPAEVERVLEGCPGIRAAAVFGLDDPTWGQIVAGVLVAPQPPGDEFLLDYLEARLASHKRPRRIGFVPRLPLTAAGKLDRSALPPLAPSLRPLIRRH